MSEEQFEPVQLPRPGSPDLGISFLKPKDWQLLQLPDEPTRFNEPGYFQPLAIAMASYGTVLFTAAARPAFEDGSVRQWAQWLCSENKIEVLSGSDSSIAGFDGCLVEGQQPSDVGKLRMRLFFFEDGRRLFQTSVVAPEQIWPSLEQQLSMMQRSFRIDQTLGRTAPVAPIPVESEPQPEAESATTPAETAPVDPSTFEGDPTPEIEPTRVADVALSADCESLKESHPMNARLRDNGVGLVPRVVSIDEPNRFAVLAAAAISATFTVPLGWHVIDDGKRTLIFDAPGKMQINLSRRMLGGTIEQAVEEIIAQYTSEQPEVQHLKLDAFGMKCVAFRNFRVDGELLEQVFMFRDSPLHPGTMLVCRVTADSDNINFATNAAEVVLRDLSEVGPQTGPPAWKQQVDTLEKLGQLEAAEELLLKSIDHLGVYSSTAYLWEKEVARRAAAGDEAGAKAAARRASDWLYQYAASATSGGEGTALSAERDERLLALKPYLDA